MQGRTSGAKRSPERGGDPDKGGSDTTRETQEDDKRYRKVRFLLQQDDTLSRSQIRRSIAYDGDGIKWLGSTLMSVHP